MQPVEEDDVAEDKRPKTAFTTGVGSAFVAWLDDVTGTVMSVAAAAANQPARA